MLLEKGAFFIAYHVIYLFPNLRNSLFAQNEITKKAIKFAMGSANQAPERPFQEDSTINKGIRIITSRKNSKNMAKLPLPSPINIFIKIIVGAVKTNATILMRNAGMAMASNSGSLVK